MDLIDQQAENDFHAARAKAFYRDIIAHLMGKPSFLLPFEAVKGKLKIKSQTYKGLKTVEVDKIIGSLDRYKEFDNAFLPKKDHIRKRWIQIDRAVRLHEPLPPVQLYQIGDAYFVEDGNHRISVAKELDIKYIDAEIIEFKTNVEIDKTTDMKQLILKSEYSDFLSQTGLENHQLDGAIFFSKPGRYQVLLQHIQVHQYFKGIDEKRPVSLEEAALSWYQNLYLPMIKIFRKKRILKKFPNRTESDLYLWVTNHKYFLMQRYGNKVSIEQAALDFEEKYKLSRIQVILEKLGFMQRD